MSGEEAPLLGGTSSIGSESGPPLTSREHLFRFLEAKTPGGVIYERFIVFLIVLNVITFVLSSLFVPEYNDVPWAYRDGGVCGNLCDALWFGNYEDNSLEFLNLGSTSVLELVTVAVFSVEYILRLYVADLEDSRFSGCIGRIYYVPTFFSLVDLASTVPFYIDAFVLRNTDLVASSFLRMFRLLRMMRVEGRYDTALTMVDDVWQAQKKLLGVALFVGVTTWLTVSSLYYLVERRSTDMIYCGNAPQYCRTRTLSDGTVIDVDTGDIDTSLCEIDYWGFTNCTAAGCPPTEDEPEPCYNLFQSIPSASYYALLNIFGEFPLIDQHSALGMLIGTLTAVVAVAVFALPAGIIGNGFENEIEKRRDNEIAERGIIVEEGGITEGFEPQSDSFRANVYRFVHACSVPGSLAWDYFVDLLVVGTVCTFMIDTVAGTQKTTHVITESFEFVAVMVFTLDYALRVFSIVEDPKYPQGPIKGRIQYMRTFLPITDLLSVLPYWIEAFMTGHFITPFDPSGGSNSMTSGLVGALRLLRIFRFEKYTHCFSAFDDVLSRNWDVLAVTAFTALLFWIFFSAFLYLTERNNRDDEMRENYKTVPHAMWITLLNLSGEAPLAQYSLAGKIATGILGVCATGIFGIPIGLLGAGFEEVIDNETEDRTIELEGQSDGYILARSGATPSQIENLGSSFERTAYMFVNGIQWRSARIFEAAIYVLIFAAVGVGVLQTVEGHEHDFEGVEWFAVVVFTIEYIIRLVGAGADPQFAPGRNAITSRLRFIFSFYSIIDLVAILPFYIVFFMPNSFVNQYDEYLRMARIVRLIKLDKYIPSITLVDDVIRLKADALKVASYAAITLWVLFASLLYVFENHDTTSKIDNLPDYGCTENCAMDDRFQNFFDSLVYTGIHMTGDYPIVEYSWFSRFVNFFMVIAAIGVVSIPSALICSGFVAIVQSKTKAREAARRGITLRDLENERSEVNLGDDWYEHRYRELEGTEPPPSRFGAKVDELQTTVNEFLNGINSERSDAETEWTLLSKACRLFIFTLIITNVIAVILESIPGIDRAVGNEPGNFFDVFEAFSVFVFAAEYIARLFCAPKNRKALYSTRVYATTFFGIVDLLSTAPWFVAEALIALRFMDADSDSARIFRIFRIFRILQLEDFVTAFSKLDNVFRASKEVLKATGLMALVIWVCCGALFYIFEENNPNWRSCDDSIPLRSTNTTEYMGCYDFASTAECNSYYEDGMCEQKVFTNMPNSLFLTAVFLGGEWGVVDFTWPGRLVCMFLCVVGIGLAAIPIGSLFDSFGAVVGLDGDEEEEDD